MKQGNPTNVEFKLKCAYMEKNVHNSVYHIYVLSYKIMPSLEYQIIVYIYREMWMKICIQGLWGIKIG